MLFLLVGPHLQVIIRKTSNFVPTDTGLLLSFLHGFHCKKNQKVFEVYHQTLGVD